MVAPVGVAVSEDQSKAGQQASGRLGAEPAGVQRLDVHIHDRTADEFPPRGDALTLRKRVGRELKDGGSTGRRGFR
jgi:hypothetical protein